MMNKIKLTNDTINADDINELCDWLVKIPNLTKGQETLNFEKEWSVRLGRKHSVFVNSGSSANLAMIYSLLVSNRLRNKNIIVPSVSWVTTVAPVIQLGLNPILCECDKDTLGIDINDFERLIKLYNPSALLLVHVLAFPCKMDEIVELCNKYDIILLEDSCESVGSKYNNKYTGAFGLMSTFSTYFSHHFSTVEGGFITTDDDDIYKILLAIRSHGWDRDFTEDDKMKIRKRNNIDEFKASFTFYYPGFNIRSTDIQAKLGLIQLKKLDQFIKVRNKNFELYDELIENSYWKIQKYDNCFYSNFTYPIITPRIKELVQDLKNNNVESRPLICGSIGLQPFWIHLYGESHFKFADQVHEYGLYLPNNQDITSDDIVFISTIVNKYTKGG